MRNVKVLWGMLSILLVAVGVLSSVLTARLYQQSDADAHSKPEPPSKAEQERAIASIGEQVITRQDLQQQLLQKYGKQVLDQMIDREVVRREAGAVGIKADEPEIKRELERMQQGYESESQFYQAMEQQLGLTRDELNADVKHKLLMEKVSIQGIRVADGAVEDYIRNHQEEFKPTVRLRLEQIVTASKDQANRASSDLARGTDFAKVAKERSLDDATRNSGGDLGWLDEDDPFTPPAILKAGKQLQPGQVSKPIEVDGKYVLLRLKEQKVLSKGSDEAIREQVRRELALREAPPMKETMAKLRVKWNVQIRESELVASG